MTSPLWSGDTGSRQESVSAGSVTIRRDNQCLNGFAGVTNRTVPASPTKPSENATLEFQVHIALTPGCERGMQLPTGVWPEFPQHPRFESPLSRQTPGREQSYEALISELVSDEQPPLRENRSIRTLDFKLKAEKTSAAAKDLLITIKSGDEKLQTLKIPVSANKPSPGKNRGVRTEGVTI